MAQFRRKSFVENLKKEKRRYVRPSHRKTIFSTKFQTICSTFMKFYVQIQRVKKKSVKYYVLPTFSQDNSWVFGKMIPRTKRITTFLTEQIDCYQYIFKKLHIF